MREQAIYAENLDFTCITAANQPALVAELARWRDANPQAAVLDIAYADGYSYAPDASRQADWGVCSVLITLQRP